MVSEANLLSKNCDVPPKREPSDKILAFETIS